MKMDLGTLSHIYIYIYICRLKDFLLNFLQGDRNKNNIFPRLLGFIVAITLATVVFYTTWNIGFECEHQIHVVTAFVVLVWFFLLVTAQGLKQYKIQEISTAVVIFLGISLYLNSIWYEGYITSTPLLGIDATFEGLHRDTLYNSAITQSVKYYGYPSLLINSAAFHNYHFGSHIIFAIISKIANIPVIFVYCYIYPMVFFPLFASLILSIGSGIKERILGIKKISIPDLFITLSFLTFFLLPKILSEGLAILKTSWLVSETYCVAIVLLLIFLKLCINFSSSKFFQNKIFNGIFTLVVVPFFIIAIALSKISVGLVLAFIVSYFLFRTKTSSKKYILLELSYVGLAFLVHYIPYLFYSPIPSTAAGEIQFYLFHHIKNYVAFPQYLWVIHIFVSYFFSIVFLSYRLKNYNTFEKFVNGIKNKELIVEETLFFVCILGALPGLFIAIDGGSAAYFSSIQQILAVILLIGYNVPAELFKVFNYKKNWVIKITTIILCIYLSIHFFCSSLIYAGMLMYSCTLRSTQYNIITKESGYWHIVSEINKITAKHKKDYYIYISPTANIWTKFRNSDAALFFYPAMTGIVCIGALYFENGQLYANNGVPKDKIIANEPKIKDARLDLFSAYRKAKKDGKKAIIYLYDNTMSLIDIK